MARLFLVSHASTRALEQVRFPTDEPISERGRRELTRARPPVVDRWVAAPERRAVETARALGAPAEVEPALLEIEPALRDVDYGSWAGLPMDSVAEGDLTTWLTDPAASPHGGESLEQLLVRVREWLSASSPAPERIAVVTHPAVVRAVVVCALDAPPAAFWRVDVRPLSVTRFHGRPGRWTLRLQ